MSSGGDQQRDAESFTTRLPNELPHSAGFAAAASTAPVVVACTVQQEGLKQKVLADLAGICAQNAAPVEHVAFFSAHPISEGVTHDLQQTAREKYGVTLNIFCGGDIATFLAQPDLVWVARHYLELPSHLVPPPEGEPAPQWYADLIEGLRHNNGPIALTPAVQGEVTRGLRHATWDEDANADLPEWLNFMGAFLADTKDGADTELVFRACYEMAVARFRGMGIAAGVEDLVRRAIDYACTSNQPNIIDDAVILVSYWGGMWSAGVARTEASEIAVAVAGLETHLVAQLDATDANTHPVRAATLTGALASVHLVPDWEKVEVVHGKPEPADVSPASRGTTGRIRGRHLCAGGLRTVQVRCGDDVPGEVGGSAATGPRVLSCSLTCPSRFSVGCAPTASCADQSRHRYPAPPGDHPNMVTSSPSATRPPGAPNRR